MNVRQTNFTTKLITMKTLKLLCLLILIQLNTQAQTPAIHSTLPVGGTVSELIFKGKDTAFCIIGVNLYRSTDGAKTWVLSKGLQFGGPYNFTSLEVRGSKVIGGLNSGGRYYESNDAGQTWSDVKFIGPNQRLSDLQFVDDLNGYAICSGNSGSVNDVQFLKTTDGGATWSSPFAFPKRGYDAQVQFLNPTFGLVFYQEFLYRTKDGGATWDTVNGISSSIKSAYIYNEQLAFVGVNEGSLLKSTDDLNTWQAINPNGRQDWENQILFLSPNKGIVSEGYNKDYKITLTTDGGFTWTTFADGVNFKKFVYQDDQTIYLFGANNNIYKTSITSSGVNKNTQSNIQYYPNPSTGKIYLNVPQELIGKNIQVYNTNGVLVKSIPCNDLRIKIELENAGLYLLKYDESAIGKIMVE